MDSIGESRGLFAENEKLASDRMTSQDAKLPADVDMEVIDHPEHSQSTWGHRLRLNIRSRLLDRGVDLRLIEDTKDQLPQPNDQAQHELVAEHVNADVAGAAEDSASWAQDVTVWPKMLLQTIGSHKPGICKLCSRTMTNITRHHVHPRVGPTSQRLPPPDMKDSSHEYLETTVDLCRPCHSMIHYIIPNKVMSDFFYSIPLLETHPRVKAWVDWVRRQRIPTPQPFTQPTAFSGRRSRKKPKAYNISARAERLKKKQEKMRKSAETTKDALAKLWNDSRNAIPRSFDSLPALKQKLREIAGGKFIRTKAVRRLMLSNIEYHAWYSWVFHGDEDAALGHGRRRRKDVQPTDHVILQTEATLEKIWLDAGNGFPKVETEPLSRAEVLLDIVGPSVRNAKGAHIPAALTVTELQKAMRQDVKYRKWFEWIWPDTDWIEGNLTNVQSSAIDDKHGGNGDDEPQHGGPNCVYGTGTGSRADPVVLDVSDSETEMDTQRGNDNATVTPSGRVIIDLTLDEDHAMEDDRTPSSDGRSHAHPVFFFDLGNRQ